MTVGELRNRMDVSEVAGWVAYWRYKRALEDQARQEAEMRG